MQRIQLDPDEKITRKEYLKRKKRQYDNIKTKSKTSALFILVLVLLSIYVFTQFYVYSKENNYTYVAGEDVENQKIYNVYYVTEGYTYDPVYSLNLILSNGFNDTSYYSNSLLTNINVDENYIYGIKNEGIYRIKKDTKEMETVVEKNVSKYVIFNNRIYYITIDDKKVAYYDLESKKNEVSKIDKVTEILIDENYIYAVREDGENKSLLKISDDFKTKTEIKKDINISYIIQDDSNLYFVNKSDNNKIYTINKDGKNYKKVGDIVCISDDGNLKEIDGRKYMFCQNNKLYFINANKKNSLSSIDLNTKEVSTVISSNVEILQNIDTTVYYKLKGEMGVYLFNFDTNFSSQITNRKLKEFVVDSYQEIDEKNIKYDKTSLKG
jgi:hypothetical protein